MLILNEWMNEWMNEMFHKNGDILLNVLFCPQHKDIQFTVIED